MGALLLFWITVLLVIGFMPKRNMDMLWLGMLATMVVTAVLSTAYMVIAR